MASDRADNFILATGPVDGSCEAVYFLDGISGTLSAGVLSKMGKPFQALYVASVGADLTKMVTFLNQSIKQGNQGGRRSSAPPTPEIQMPQNPHFLMVTGNMDLRPAGAARQKPSVAVIYVAETNTGIVMVYMLPWDASRHAANLPDSAQLIPLTAHQFSAPVIAAGGN
jgi:hypothetical protein